MSETDEIKSGHQQLWFLILLATSSILFAWRMFVVIDELAVNLLTWDLWDIYSPTLFERRSSWELIRHQVGQTRQGPGFLVTRFVAEMSSMNTRAESFAIGVVFCFSAGAAIWLKWRVSGSWSLADTIIPAIVLTALQQDTWVGVPNLSVGAASLLFLILLCLSWTIHRQLARVVAVVVSNALLVNSGYGFLAAPFAPVLFSLELYEARRQGDKSRASWAGVGLAGSLAAPALFLHGWVFTHSTCTETLGSEELMLPGFVVLMLAKFVGLDFDHLGLFATIAGTVIIGVMVEVLLRQGRQVVSGREGGVAARVIAILVGFSLVYSFAAAYGRICESLLVSQASRHMTFMVPAFLGLYFDLLTRTGFRWRKAALAILCAGALFGGFSVELVTDDGAARLAEDKRRWKECYLRTENVPLCESETHFRIYPAGSEVVLPPRLKYLKENRLNLYLGR